MTEFEAPHERLVERLEPLAHLLHGETLVGAGKFRQARAEYSEGLAQTQARHDVQAEPQCTSDIITASFHYSCAEAWRLEIMGLAAHRRTADRQDAAVRQAVREPGKRLVGRHQGVRRRGS